MTTKKRKHRKRELNRLEPVSVKKKRPGFWPDGNGLYLSVKESGSRSWILRTMVHGQRKDIGLGGIDTTSLADARAEAQRLRADARKGKDILAERRLQQRKANIPTFEELARKVHTDVVPTLKNEHNKVVWLTSLENHVFPVFGSKPVDLIDSADVLKVITPIWTKTPDMASKILRHITKVIDVATINGDRNVMAGNITVPLPNPCAGIRSVLPKQPKDVNYAAVRYQDVPMFIEKLRVSKATLPVRLAMEFTVLTACRSAEVLKATWSEIDMENRTWRIPASRMKMDVEHEVFLSDRALEILEEAKKLDAGPCVFPSTTPGEPLSNVAMIRALQRMPGYKDVTMHGMRSAFKTFSEERTKFKSKVIEACLAHKIGDTDTEARYMRGTFAEQRKQLLQVWSRFCVSAPAENVVRMSAG